MDIRAYNRNAWNRYVDGGESLWTQPVSPEIIARARKGDFSIVLTEQKPVPCEWFPPLNGLDTLCLASGGGQQGPVLAAAGSNVTVFDNSPRQLDQDRFVAEREGLTNLKTVTCVTCPYSMTSHSTSSSTPFRICSSTKYVRSGAKPSVCCAMAERCWPVS